MSIAFYREALPLLIDLLQGDPYHFDALIAQPGNAAGPLAFDHCPAGGKVGVRGFRLALVGGTDFSCNNKDMGHVRTWAYVDGKLTYDAWVEAGYPLKMHEYLASGGPVVSADLPSVRPFGDVVAICDIDEKTLDAKADHKDWPQAVREAREEQMRKINDSSPRGHSSIAKGR